MPLQEEVITLKQQTRTLRDEMSLLRMRCSKQEQEIEA